MSHSSLVPVLSAFAKVHLDLRTSESQLRSLGTSFLLGRLHLRGGAKSPYICNLPRCFTSEDTSLPWLKKVRSTSDTMTTMTTVVTAMKDYVRDNIGIRMTQRLAYL